MPKLLGYLWPSLVAEKLREAKEKSPLEEESSCTRCKAGSSSAGDFWLRPKADVLCQAHVRRPVVLGKNHSRAGGFFFGQIYPPNRVPLRPNLPIKLGTVR